MDSSKDKVEYGMEEFPPGRDQANQQPDDFGEQATGYEKLGIIGTIRTFKKATLICFLMTFAAATDGYQIGMNGNVVANAGFVDRFGTETNAAGKKILAASVLSAISAIQSVGQIIGMTTLPFLSARFGRKAAMYTLWLLLVFSVICETVARQWPVWFVAKLFSGIGVGSLQITSPVYVTEVAPIKIRGMLLLSYNFWFVVGAFMATVALQSMYATHPDNYLTPVYTQWAQIGIMGIIYLLVPESPYWCATRGKHEQGIKTLAKINGSVSGYNVEEQYEIMREKWYNIFRGVDGFRTLVSMWAITAQQFLGLKVFFTYTAYFFSIAGLQDPFQASVITSAIQIVAILVAVLLADRFGRRLICCGGLTTMFLTDVAVGILGFTKAKESSRQLAGGQFAGSAGWGYVGEMSSQRLRPYTAGFAAATSCVVGVVMDVLVPYMLNTNQWNWGLKTCWFYAGAGLPAVIVAWLIIPETAGRSAAELDELFERKIKPWRFHKTTTALQRAVTEDNTASSDQ
ncbi:hypothetical protein JCM24511_07345 [Saitozyma sp. JCM 24511]|nr:hypothetical protein JCM24511_07345 [Saitozyma sp. JCM 24511]